MEDQVMEIEKVGEVYITPIKPMDQSRMLADAQIKELLDFVEYACVRFAPDQEDAIRRGEELLINHGRMERPRVG